MIRLPLLIAIIFFTLSSFCCDTTRYNILFDSDQHELNEQALNDLQHVLSELDQLDSCSIFLVGHTDPHGSVSYNEKLAKRRVNSVHHYLLNENIVFPIQKDSKGELDLKDHGSGEASDQINRRVEIVVIAPCEQTSTETNFDYEDIPDRFKESENCSIDTAQYLELLNTCLVSDTSSTSVVVMDWTRSMYPYGSNLYKWHMENLDKSSIVHLTMFNDGDDKKQRKKKMGETRGIYFADADQPAAVVKLMKKVARKGTGGDFPENYIEALIRTEEKYPQADTIILLADNRACIRDYRLIEQLTRPIKIILNEIDTANKIINYQYLNLAAYTGGKVYFMDHEIDQIQLQNNQVKPTYLEDTIIYLPRVKGSLKKADQAIYNAKKEQQKYSIPAILEINNQPYERCSKEALILQETPFQIGCVECKMWDFRLKAHVTFVPNYTFRQKTARALKAIGKGIAKPFRKKSKKGKSSTPKKPKPPMQ